MHGHNGTTGRKQIAVFAGCCACGKGTTIAAYIKKYGGVHVSSSALLEDDPEEAARIAAGIMCTDQRVIELVESRLLHRDCNGFVLMDGFWRKELQFDWLQSFCQRAGFELLTIYPEIDKGDAREWYENRIVCGACRTPHSKRMNDPCCTVCGGSLTLRHDHDKFEKRFKDFEELVLPLVDVGGRARKETPFLTFDAKLPVPDKVEMIYAFVTQGVLPEVDPNPIMASTCV